MAFTFPVDTNSKAGAVRQNPIGTGFHVPTILYGADGVTPAKIKKNTPYTPSTGVATNFQITPGTELVIISNHEFDGGTGSWLLTMQEVLRPNTENLTYLKVKVSISNAQDAYNPVSGTHDTLFSRTFSLSELDEVDKVLFIPEGTSVGNMLITGKPFNVPLGRYMRVSIINDHPAATIGVKGVNVVESGWY